MVRRLLAGSLSLALAACANGDKGSNAETDAGADASADTTLSDVSFDVATRRTGWRRI